jgi:hypothetical protein
VTRPRPLPPPTPADEARYRLLAVAQELGLRTIDVGGAWAELHETAIAHETDPAKIDEFTAAIKANPSSVLPQELDAVLPPVNP